MSIEPDPMRPISRMKLPVMRMGSDEIVGEAELFIYADTGYGAVVINNATMEALGSVPGARFFPGVPWSRMLKEVKNDGENQD